MNVHSALSTMITHPPIVVFDLHKADTCTLELRRIRFNCTEICKILNQNGPSYMSNLITPRQSHNSSRRSFDLFVPRVNQIIYGLKSFWHQGSKLFNSLPDGIKTSTNLSTFKELLKNWNGPIVIADLRNDNREINGHKF